ncbi:hypothetical protein V495_08718, partial [Pseudogymnoascus sp. VKM F-4514 (FW-929)]
GEGGGVGDKVECVELEESESLDRGGSEGAEVLRPCDETDRGARASEGGGGGGREEGRDMLDYFWGETAERRGVEGWQT